MKIPNIIKIGPYLYEVIQGENDSGDDGLCKPDKLKLFIDDNNPKSRTANTLWHECGHAIWELFRLDDEAKEEDAVNAFATGLQMLFTDNPDLKKFL